MVASASVSAAACYKADKPDSKSWVDSPYSQTKTEAACMRFDHCFPGAGKLAGAAACYKWANSANELNNPPAKAPVAAAPAASAPTVLPQAQIDACIKYVDDKLALMKSKFDFRQKEMTTYGDKTLKMRDSNTKVFTAYTNQLNASKNAVLNQRTKKSCDDAKADVDGKEKLFPQQIQ